MERNVGAVKPPRPYDSSGRRERARQSRERILDIARDRFLAQGFVTTTVVEIASQAGVSTDTIFKTFGGKTGLAKEVIERGLEGLGPVAAESRSDRMQAEVDDPREITRGFGVLAAEVAPRVAPLLLLLAASAEADPRMAQLREELDSSRLVRMTHNAQALADRGFLRAGVSVEEAGQIGWVYSAPELYRLLVIEQGWTPERFGGFVGDALGAALLTISDSPAGPAN